MSYKVTLNCKNCNSKKSFVVGQKRSDAIIGNIISELSQNNKDRMNKIIIEDNLLSFTFYRELGLCEECKEYYAVPILNIYTKSGDIVRLEGECPKCGSNPKVYHILDDESSIKCLDCDMGDIEISTENIYD